LVGNYNVTLLLSTEYRIYRAEKEVCLGMNFSPFEYEKEVCLGMNFSPFEYEKGFFKEGFLRR